LKVLSAVTITVTFSAIASLPAAADKFGEAELVFKYGNQACETWDIPDAAARAFRDARGRVHLFAAAAKNRAFVGATLATIAHNCDVTYAAGQSDKPADFDDEGWLESFYTIDGKTVFGLVSMDYHPGRHGLPCDDAGECWYSAITWAISKDGGEHFSSPSAPARFVTGPLENFDNNHSSPRGAFVPTNIVQKDGYFYAMISFASDGQQKGGDCLFRTSNLSDPQSWRAWDGSGFNIAFVSPYSGGSDIAQRRPCPPVGSNNLSPPVRTLARTLSGGFIAVFLKGSATSDMPEGAYVSYSDDLVHWGNPKLLLSFNVFDPKKCRRGTSLPSYWYPSLIDPSAKSLSFDVIGRSAYLFLTRFNNCGYADRDLVRLKVAVPAK
jgi:hypothetical protein